MRTRKIFQRYFKFYLKVLIALNAQKIVRLAARKQENVSSANLLLFWSRKNVFNAQEGNAHALIYSLLVQGTMLYKISEFAVD